MDHQSLRVSVVIPMRNEEKYIGRCLDSIIANHFPAAEYEVIVVDGDSSDRSRDIVLERQTLCPRLRLLRNPRRVIPSALNLGIEQARGRYIVRMDAHSEYPPDYIANCVSELERTGATNVGGRWLIQPGADTPIAATIALITQNPVVVGNAQYRLGHGDRYVDTVPFGAFRRETFDRVGLFREDLSRHEDYELNARIRRAGGKIFLSSRIHNTYYNVPTFKRFMRQAWQNGLWCGRAWLRYPVSFHWRHAVPLLFFLGVLGEALCGLVFRPLLWLAFAVFSVYVLACFAVGVRVASEHGWRHLFLAPALMGSYHLAYGISTLFGLVDGAIYRWRAHQGSAAALEH
jgi:glycosyltransferase involved in cell wall biosynthesis